MNQLRLEDLYNRLEIPNSEIAKFDLISKSIDINYVTTLFYNNEDGFFEYLDKEFHYYLLSRILL